MTCNEKTQQPKKVLCIPWKRNDDISETTELENTNFYITLPENPNQQFQAVV